MEGSRIGSVGERKLRVMRSETVRVVTSLNYFKLDVSKLKFFLEILIASTGFEETWDSKKIAEDLKASIISW